MTSQRSVTQSVAILSELILCRNAKDAGMTVKGAPKHYAVGNLCLFLAGDMSEDIAGSVVRLDGSYQ